MVHNVPDSGRPPISQPNGAVYLRPTALSDALFALGDRPDWSVVAGGTDHFPARVGARAAEPVLDISGIAGLKGISRIGDRYRIGAATTWTDILEADLPDAFNGLKAAARQVGGVQIQNRGTIAGNICNASPAADGIPPLLSLQAQVVVAGQSGQRVLDLRDFITGYRTTDLNADELVIALDIPAPDPVARSAFLKLGARHYLVISIAMVAGVIVPTRDGCVGDIRIVVGACSAVAQRLPELEQTIRGAKLSEPLSQRIVSEHFAGLSPIDDPRATAAYRKDAARTLVARLLDQMQGGIR